MVPPLYDFNIQVVTNFLMHKNNLSRTALTKPMKVFLPRQTDSLQLMSMAFLLVSSLMEVTDDWDIHLETWTRENRVGL